MDLKIESHYSQMFYGNNNSTKAKPTTHSPQPITIVEITAPSM